MPTMTPPAAEPVVESASQVAPTWNVVLHDDDVTTMEFVVHLLVTLFAQPFDEAIVLMLEVHETGAAVVCSCSQERAELYVEQVCSAARPQGFPLVASCEPG